MMDYSCIWQSGQAARATYTNIKDGPLTAQANHYFQYKHDDS